MLDKKTYKKEFIRMMDNYRRSYKGEGSCNGVECDVCPLQSLCKTARGYSARDVVEAVEQWSKEHPVVTNEMKKNEIFGDVNFLAMDPDDYDEWGKQEYKEPEKEK